LDSDKSGFKLKLSDPSTLSPSDLSLCIWESEAPPPTLKAAGRLNELTYQCPHLGVALKFAFDTFFDLLTKWVILE
jgi:hypothetical protein